jgi:hypothetical protein
MEDKPHVIPDAAVKGVASGLIMMAVFTLMWTGIAFDGGLIGTIYQWVLIIFPIPAIIFFINSINLFKQAKYFPKSASEADLAEEKRAGKWFGIIFGAEGLGIFIGINIVTNLGHPDLVIPAIALVVGLHFFPLAKVFKRTLDYYLATWATLIAVCGFIFTLNKTMPVNYITAFVGIGLAIATSCYGIYMIYYGNEILKKKPVVQSI